MPVSCRCPRRPELCYLLVRRFRHSPATVAVGPVAVTTRTRVRRLPWQAHDSGESGIATSRAPVRHMISGPNAPSSAALHAQSSSERPRSLRASGGDALGGRRGQLGADKLDRAAMATAVRVRHGASGGGWIASVTLRISRHARQRAARRCVISDCGPAAAESACPRMKRRHRCRTRSTSTSRPSHSN